MSIVVCWHALKLENVAIDLKSTRRILQGNNIQSTKYVKSLLGPLITRYKGQSKKLVLQI